eukprot:Em0947g1a
MFRCPTCERNSSIPVGGASVLPQNLHLGFEVEVAGYMSKMMNNSEVCCDECVDGRNGLAVVFCCMCHQFLCKVCRDYHSSSRRFSKHKIVLLDQAGARQLHTTMKPRDHYCSQPSHEDNKLNFYCETCSLLVCLHCTTVTHKNHTVKEISTVAKTHQMVITGALEDAKEVVTKLTGATDGNNKMIEQVEISKQTSFLAINQAFEILQQTLEERKKTLFSELEAISLSKTTALTLQKEQFEKMVRDIGHYTDMASQILQTHTDYEIVAFGGLIPTELQATLKRIQSIFLTSNQHSNITVSVQTDDLVRQLSKLGEIIVFSSSTWTSTSVARVGTRYHVKVQRKTSKGEEYPHGGVEVRGEMRSKTHNGAVVYGEVEDHRDGTYTITLTLNQLVLTSSLSQWMKLTSSGKFLHKFGQKGSGPGQFNRPWAVIIDSNNKQIVSDSDNHRIHIFNENDGRLLTIDGEGYDNNCFLEPCGLALDPQGNIHVAAYGTNTIKVFTKEGVYVRMYGDPKCPIGIAIDDEGYSLVSEWSGTCLSIYDPEGIKICKVGNLNKPRDIALDPKDGSVFIANYGANTVLKYCV